MQYRTLGRSLPDLLDAIDEIVPPGVDLAPDEKIDTVPALLEASLRRR